METLGLVLVILFVLFLRQPLLVLLFSATAYAHMVWGRGHIEDIVEDMWVGIDKDVILSIPLFVLCGNVMTRGTIATRLIGIMAAVTRPVPGGLAVAGILSCAVFASINGSSIVTMLAIGSVILPALEKAGYDLKFSLGAIMTGGTLGIIIPPSIPMIIYALVTESSLTDMFLAGVGPGLLITSVLVAYAIWVNRRMPTSQLDWQELTAAVRSGIWALLMPVILLGGIYSGFFTPTESAAVALAYAMFIEVFVHRQMKLTDFYHVVLETSKVGGALFPVLAVALSISILVTEHRLPQQLVAVFQTYIDSPMTFMVMVTAMLLMVGLLLDTISAILILAPLLAPIGAAYGIDKVTFGIIMIITLEIGYLTPPVGMNLIVAMTAFKQNFGLLCRAAMPYIALMLFCLAIVVWQPSITTVFLR